MYAVDRQQVVMWEGYKFISWLQIYVDSSFGVIFINFEHIYQITSEGGVFGDNSWIIFCYFSVLTYIVSIH